MSCLFYCICHNPGTELSGTLLGIGKRPVYQVAHRRLSAAVSRVNRADLAPDLLRVRAYERVVLSYHRRGTVVPMRYGCVVEQESQVIEMLSAQGAHYEALLQELEGCVEMGLRVLLPSGPWAAVTPGGPEGSREVAGPRPPAPAAPPGRLGLAYLTARQAHYDHQDRWTNEYRQAAARCLAQFAGLFVKSKTEAPSPRLPLLSLYFLVPRPAVESFRQAFRHLTETESARLLLSGPWPPYNFV
ncbi:MAG: GvpL/GvpF family gas vesicle protein, partial [Desulfobaccales bacterium]|nr:GvpL/GvpF family gas vesicle protein [Desulfobaccales bacterium]